MSTSRKPFRVILDTNILLRSLINQTNASRIIVADCESRKHIILLSKPVVDEYRRVLTRLRDLDDSITPFQIEVLLRKLRYMGDYLPSVRSSFVFSRDPTDAKLIELAIEGNATHLVTCDRDLLSLPKS